MIYPIIDVAVCAERSIAPLELALACLRGGARFLQIRQKNGRDAAFLDFSEALVEAARPFGAQVIVNDRADIARLAGAAGVHVGQEDLTPGDVRTILGESAVIGLSTHTDAQVDEALETAATYLAVGPIFGTATKDTGYSARGLSLVRYAANRGRPVVAIGGMTLERAPRVLDAGAWAVAVITDLLTGDAEARTREYMRLRA